MYLRRKALMPEPAHIIDSRHSCEFLLTWGIIYVHLVLKIVDVLFSSSLNGVSTLRLLVVSNRPSCSLPAKVTTLTTTNLPRILPLLYLQNSQNYFKTAKQQKSSTGLKVRFRPAERPTAPRPANHSGRDCPQCSRRTSASLLCRSSLHHPVLLCCRPFCSLLLIFNISFLFSPLLSPQRRIPS